MDSYGTEGSRRQRKLIKKWTTDESRILIEMVKSYDALWNINSDVYKNREMRETYWREIAKATDHVVVDCKTQWNSTRSRYNVL